MNTVWDIAQVIYPVKDLIKICRKLRKCFWQFIWSYSVGTEADRLSDITVSIEMSEINERQFIWHILYPYSVEIFNDSCFWWRKNGDLYGKTQKYFWVSWSSQRDVHLPHNQGETRCVFIPHNKGGSEVSWHNGNFWERSMAHLASSLIWTTGKAQGLTCYIISAIVQYQRLNRKKRVYELTATQSSAQPLGLKQTNLRCYVFSCWS